MPAPAVAVGAAIIAIRSVKEVLVAPLLFFGMLLYLLRPPRIVISAAVAMVVFIAMFKAVVRDGRGPNDRWADRDDAVEISAKALLRGENAWSQTTQLNLPITTGPASVLMALPFVLASGDISKMTLTFWALFVLGCFCLDLAYQSGRFPLACLLMLVPLAGFAHTWVWAMDEIAFAMVLVPLAWIGVEKRSPFLLGVFCGIALLVRLSYVLPAAAVVTFVFFKLGWRSALKVCAWSLATAIAIILPFVLVAPAAFFQSNYIHVALQIQAGSGLTAVSAANNWTHLVVQFTKVLEAMSPEFLRRFSVPILSLTIVILAAWRSSADAAAVLGLVTLAAVLTLTFVMVPAKVEDFQTFVWTPLVYWAMTAGIVRRPRAEGGLLT